MKEYTVQLTLISGNDEFWNDNPTPQDVLGEFVSDLSEMEVSLKWDIRNIKITRILDLAEYEIND